MIKRLGVAIAAAVVGLASLGFAPVSAASSVSISKVSIKMVVPSTVTTAGAFKMTVTGVGTFKSFDIYRQNGGSGNPFYLLKSKVNGKTYTDTEESSFGFTEYEMVPYSGKNDTGTRGSGVGSVEFVPETYPGGESACEVTTGTWHSLTGTRYFGGEAIETVGPAIVWCFGDKDYNDGLVFGTGAAGGTGKVYVNGTGAGTTVNFHSATTKGFAVLYKAGSGTVMDDNEYEIVNTGAGDMWFTGVIEASFEA